MTPARMAVATALTHTRTSEPSSTPAPNHSPAMRQTSLGRKPASTRINSACGLPKNSLMRVALPPPVHAVGNAAGGDAADQNIDAGMQHRHQRKQRDPEHQRQYVRYLPA